VITAVDVLRGIAVGAGMDVLRVPGATGYLDTDYAAKGAAAVRALDTHDLVAVHIEAPDEAGHLGDVAEKVRAIERIDEAIVAPLLDALRGQAGWGLMVAPDHPTPVGTRAHSAAPPPFCCAGSGIAQASGLPFTEADAERTGDLAQPGWSLLPSLLGAA
jgi:2,3-bisphosphoglycerate-independent phosphoglycerate mutase